MLQKSNIRPYVIGKWNRRLINPPYRRDVRCNFLPRNLSRRFRGIPRQKEADSRSRSNEARANNSAPNRLIPRTIRSVNAYVGEGLSARKSRISRFRRLYSRGDNWDRNLNGGIRICGWEWVIVGCLYSVSHKLLSQMNCHRELWKVNRLFECSQLTIILQ